MLINTIATTSHKQTQKETMACSFSPYCLGMCEWTDCPGYSSGLQLETDTFRPLPQLEQLRPSPSKDQPRFPTASNESSRFKLASEQQLSELAKGLIPENTKGSTKAVCPFTHAKTVRRETTSHRFFLSLFVTCRCYSIYEHAQRWTNQVGHITVIARVARDLWLRP